jgi:uncharacterized protein (TIGR02453 family)
MGTRYFTPQLFRFLRDLEANNDRAWFKANQAEYERAIREPALDFINDMATPLAKISPHFVADSRTVGGSLFRIQRDTRFSKDKTPYKTNTGMQFRHERGKDAHAPGFYIHIEPKESFIGVGLWRPESKLANAIREAIAADPDGWSEVAHGAAFTNVFSHGGDSLVRPPRGFDAEHPLIEDLKRKDFIASIRITQGQVTSAGFMDVVVEHFSLAGPYMGFLCEAVGLEF